MEVRKGAATSLIALSVLLFIASGNIFGAIVMDNNIQASVEYNRGDYAKIAETKIKADFYPKRMAKELQYNSNIIALEIGENEGEYEGNTQTISWGSNIPSLSELQEEYYTGIKDKLLEQNKVLGCEEPELRGVEQPESEPLTSLKASFSNPWIECEEGSTKAKVWTVEEPVVIDHTDNRYLLLAKAARKFVSNLDEKEELQELKKISTSGKEKGCPDEDLPGNPTDSDLESYHGDLMKDANEDAEERFGERYEKVTEAKQTLSRLDNIDDQAIKDADDGDIEEVKSAANNLRGNINSPDVEDRTERLQDALRSKYDLIRPMPTGKSLDGLAGRLSGFGEDDWKEFSKSEVEQISFTENEKWSLEGGDCRGGKEVVAEVTGKKVSSIDLSYTIKDSERTVVNSNGGEEEIKFSFTFTHNMDN